MFGGEGVWAEEQRDSSQREIYSDLYSFDLNTKEWNRHATTVRLATHVPNVLFVFINCCKIMLTNLWLIAASANCTLLLVPICCSWRKLQMI